VTKLRAARETAKCSDEDSASRSCAFMTDDHRHLVDWLMSFPGESRESRHEIFASLILDGEPAR
jgi:hypothetical protein